MSNGEPKKLNEGLSSELLKKGLSSSNLKAGLSKPSSSESSGQAPSNNSPKDGK